MSMTQKTSNFRDYLQNQLKNPDFKREWEAGEAQYQLVREMIKTRIEGNLSQRQLAKKAKTTQAVISRVESMSVNPSLLLVERIAKAMDKKLEIRFV